MDKITLLDTAVGSTNKGDEIIMHCAREELDYLLKKYFPISAPTHLCSFNVLECIGNLPDSANEIALSKYKFVCGTNLLSGKMLNRSNQWDINIFNCRPLIGSVLMGVGAESRNADWYTRKLYNKVLSKDFYHSVRDEKAYELMTGLGFKCLYTGCLTMWKLTEEFCHNIPTKKSKKVVFTLTDYRKDRENDKQIIDIIRQNYDDIYFWIQGAHDYEYLSTLTDISDINIIEPDVLAYERFLKHGDVDYIGTRLHAGIFAMRLGVRSIILVVDSRMNMMSKCISNNCMERSTVFHKLDKKIKSEFSTICELDWEAISMWKKQFS